MGLSRDLARWIAGVKYEDLPSDVVDRAKGVTLHGLTSALLGAGTPGGKDALELMREEEAGGGGNGTVWVDGGKLTRGGAAFVNAEMQLAGGKWDTYRMLTHPGVMIMPAAMVACEATGASGKDYITGIVCGYEVLERIARDFVPQIMSQGFHTAPVIGIIGAAVAAAKIYGFDEDRINGAIAQCANFAAGNLESGRSGGSRLTEGGAVRNALLAVALARRGRPAGETVLEGDAGFFAAYAGNNKGELDYHFEGQLHANIAYIADGLGSRYEFLNTIYRLYGVAGYNIAHIDTVADLVRDNGIKGDNIDRIEAVVNRHETVYPSAAFPAPTSDNQPRVGSTHYLAAWSALRPGYPLVDPKREDAPAGTLELMNRVTLIPSDTQTLFGPEVTIYTKDGKKFTKKATGREFIWDFDNEVRRLNGVQSGLPISATQFDALTDACRNLENLARADELIGLTVPH
jgi:2-methylcitrate dehydratase PrpD